MTAFQLELLADVKNVLRGESLALMLFGSVARGEEGSRSDTDILQISPNYRPSYKTGIYSVTVYTPDSLRSASVSGSLFVLHLKTEGMILEDPQGVLADALCSYVEPDSYGAYYAELRMAANLLNVSERFYSTRWDRCNQLALFLLRSTLFAQSAERGRPMFSIHRLATELNDLRIEDVYALKYAKKPDSKRFGECVNLVLEYLRIGFSASVDAAQSILTNASGKSELTVSMARRLLGMSRLSGYGVFINRMQ